MSAGEVTLTGTTDAELTGRFAPVFARIAEGTPEREAGRRLPYEEVEWLRAAGFGRIRVPREYGGLGASLPQFFRQLIELGRADSNLPQLLRGHFGFVETRLVHRDPAVRDRWLRRITDGALVGNAQSERGNRSFWENETTIARAPEGGWRLNGKKFYSTGSLFADWIHTTATLDTTRSADVLVPTGSPGVTRLDDWDGFGQRLTGSGTTLFDDALVQPEDVEIYDNGQLHGSSLGAFFQLVHLATLAGIGRAALDDTVGFVRGRTRNLADPAHPAPRQEPFVQQVVGRLSGASLAATATTLAAVDAVETVHRAQSAGTVSPADFDEADAVVYAAQGQIIGLVLGLVTDLFEVGGASAVTERFRLDRHWRNARTLASHNPVVHRDRIVGDHLLNGTSPSEAYTRSWEAVRDRGQS